MMLTDILLTGDNIDKDIQENVRLATGRSQACIYFVFVQVHVHVCIMQHVYLLSCCLAVL